MHVYNLIIYKLYGETQSHKQCLVEEAVHLSKMILALNLFMQMFNVSTMCIQSNKIPSVEVPIGVAFPVYVLSRHTKSL